MYGKLFSSMYKGTLYGHWEAIVTFQQLIVLADADGIVDMTPQAICAHTSIPIDILEKGLKKLAEPDAFSRTPGEEGRRIVCIDEHRPWGWQIVNYLKYKHLKDSNEIREQTRERVRRFREKRNAGKQDVTDVTLGNAEKRHTDTDTDTDTDTNTKKQLQGRAVALPDWLPQEAWSAWLEVRSKNRAPNTPRALRLAVAELARLKAAGHDVKAVLEQSTLRGWRGIFPVKAEAVAIDHDAFAKRIEEEDRKRAGV